MIEGILIGIAANIVTEFGKKTLKNIFKDDSLDAEINKAFNDALNIWTVNHDIKEKEKIFSQKRFTSLIECIKDPEKINDLDKVTADLINLFKLELQKSTTAWHYVQDVQFQEALSKSNSIEHHLNRLKSDVISHLEQLEELFDDALIPYKDAFSHQLNPENKNLTTQLHNKFIGRESDLESLDYLIKQSDDKVIAVVSDGGYGKTRLCIEYFQKYIDPDENIDAWVLNTSGLKNLNFSSKLQDGKQTIILIDDAHKYPKVINDVVHISNQHKNVKILMTVRSALYDATVSELASHNRRITSHTIERLSYEETQELFRSQLPGLGDVEIKKLAVHSKGIPIVILGLCQVTINGKYKSEISEEENFRLFVKEQKQQVIDDIHAKYYTDKEKINKTIELLSFFAPVRNTDEEIAQISSLNGINIDETAQILDYLEEDRFILRNTEIVISPDPYSDTILINSSTRIKYLLQEDISIFRDRLIRNLVEVESSERLTFDVDNLLSEFLLSFRTKSTETRSDISSLVANLETLKSFTYKKPRICYFAVRDLIISKHEEEDFWQKEEPRVFYRKSFKEVHENIETILYIIALNTHNPHELEDVYELIWNYKKHRPNSSVFSKAFGYKVYDFEEYGFLQQFPFHRQKFLLTKLEFQLKEEPEDEFVHNLIFDCVKFLMIEEFEGESYFDKYTHRLLWNRHRVSQNEHTEKIRIDSLSLLFQLYELTRPSNQSNDYFDFILRVLYYMYPKSHNKKQFDQTKETEMVIDFLLQILDDDPSLSERGKIIRQLKIFERKEIKEEYKNIRDELLLKSESVATAKEKLSLLLLDEYDSLRNNIDTLFKEIIVQYTDNRNFFEDLVEVKAAYVKDDYLNFHELFSYLVENQRPLSKELLDFIIEKYPEHVRDFANLIQANYTDSNYFYSIINKVWSLGVESAKGAVLWMLTNGRNRQVDLYKEDDLIYFEYVVKNNLSEQLWSVNSTLSQYIHIQPERTLKIISYIFEISTNERGNGFILHSIFTDKEIVESNTELVKDFVFRSTLSVSIDDSYLKDVLIFLDDHFGFDTLLEYLIEKVEFFEKNQDSVLLSYHQRYTNPSKSPEQTEIDFIKVINWYAELDLKSEYIHKVLVKFLRPIYIETESFKSRFKELVENAGDDIDKVVELCKALDVFESKGEFLISMLIEVANTLCKKHKIDEPKLVDIFGSDYIFNHCSRTGTAGEPFPQDIAKKKELLKIKNTYEMHPDVKSVIEQALGNVDKAINMDFYKGEKW